MEIRPYERAAQYWETDQMGVIHHSNYIRWFEEARVHILNAAGLHYAEMERDGVLLPLLSASCDYIKPTRFGDTVRIEARVADFISTHGIRFAVNYVVRDARSGQINATGQTRHCFTDKELRILRVKRDHPQIYGMFARMEREGQAE